jgi:hypothetical protein
MMKLVAILAAIAALVGLTALAVERFDDRELFVPPPDAVAEGFAREVTTGRYDRAREYLEDSSPWTREDLRRMDERLGNPTQVEAEVLSRTDEQALVNVRLTSAERSQAIAFELKFEQEWKIVTPSGTP